FGAIQSNADSGAASLRLSRLAEGFGEAGVVELVVAVHLAVRQLEDVDPGARPDLAGLSNAEADIAHRDDGVVLGDHGVHRVVRHVHRAAERLEELGHAVLARELPGPRHDRIMLAHNTAIVVVWLVDLLNVTAPEALEDPRHPP